MHFFNLNDLLFFQQITHYKILDDAPKGNATNHPNHHMHRNPLQYISSNLKKKKKKEGRTPTFSMNGVKYPKHFFFSLTFLERVQQE